MSQNSMQENPAESLSCQKLCELPPGHSSIIYDLSHTGNMRRRLLDLGFIKGTKVTCIQTGPSGDPIAFYIKGIVIALRKEDAEQIIVTKDVITEKKDV